MHEIKSTIARIFVQLNLCDDRPINREISLESIIIQYSKKQNLVGANSRSIYYTTLITIPWSPLLGGIAILYY